MQIVFYETNDGYVPVKDFLSRLSDKMRARAFWVIDCLKIYASDIREPYSKHLGDGIFELRIKAGNDISRILYFFFVGDTAVLTNGFIKKTQKTPSAEIEKSRKYRNDYIRRNGE